MDTSETYIKMCEKAEEIQGEWNEPKEGDYYLAFHNQRCIAGLLAIWTGKEEGILRLAKQGKYFIWLPRQDQLQEMVSFGPPSQVHMIMDFMDSNYWKEIAEDGIEEYTSPEEIFDTWEQLWLAFVMKEKYGKVWDGENWIKES